MVVIPRPVMRPVMGVLVLVVPGPLVVIVVMAVLVVLVVPRPLVVIVVMAALVVRVMVVVVARRA